MAKESHDQKRKRKLAAERRRALSHELKSLVYTGNKYKTDELAPAWMHTEIGIYETFVMSDRTMTDQTVAEAIEKLIHLMRNSEAAPALETGGVSYSVGEEQDLLIANVRRNWASGFAAGRRPSNDQLTGVLRSLLGTIKLMRTPGPQSQGFLLYSARFLTNKLGVSVQSLTEEQYSRFQAAPANLVELGHQWIADSNPEARTTFMESSEQLIKTGRGGLVIDDGHTLMEELPNMSAEIHAELRALVFKASESLM